MALPNQRVGESQGSTFNITKGSQTEVLAKEAVFHHYLDQAGYRWQKDKRNELFQASPEKLLEQLRKVQGVDLYLFDSDAYRSDPMYDGGQAPPMNITTLDGTRIVPTSTGQRTTSVVVYLSKSRIEQLRSGDPTGYDKLVDIISEIENLEPAVSTVKVSKKKMAALQSSDPATSGAAAASVVRRVTRSQTRGG